MSLALRRTRGARAVLPLVALLAGCASGGPGSQERDRTLGTEQRTDAARTNVGLASGYLEQGRVELALEKVNRALALDPSFAQAHSLAGIISERIGDHEAARRHYRRSVQLDGSSGRLLNNYGQFLCKIGEVEDGVTHLERAIEDPFYETPAVALTNAGACLEQAGDPERAERYYRRALERNERYPDALFLMSRLMMRRDDAFRARAFLQRYEAVAAPSYEALELGLEIETALDNADAVKNYSDRLMRLDRRPGAGASGS